MSFNGFIFVWRRRTNHGLTEGIVYVFFMEVGIAIFDWRSELKLTLVQISVISRRTDSSFVVVASHFCVPPVTGAHVATHTGTSVLSYVSLNSRRCKQLT